MGFPAILSGGDLSKIREGEYSATPYLLVNPINIVFSAQLDQSSFDVAFATVEFDNVTTGVIADALDGFTVYIGDIQDDIRDAAKNGFVGRVRDGSAGSTLNINETSAELTDDQYIMVVKDVAIREKLGRYVSKVMTVDWDISFRELLPRVTGLDSCYVGALSGGVSDFTFPAVGNVTTTGASISSWLWDADGGAFINGTVSTDAQPDIRYTVAGVYWPRVEVTDSGGRVGWFTMPVFVPSADLSDDFIVTGLEQLSISSQLATGQEMRFNYFSDELDDVVKQTFIALWVVDDYNGSSTPILNEIAFVGRMRREDPKHKTDDESGVLPETNFVCEGILGQLGRIRCPQLALIFDATPTQFGEINNMTQWRCVSFILTEFSTAANVCSLSFDIEDNTYLNREDSPDNTSLLAGANGLYAALKKGALNQSSTGHLFASRNANFMTTAQRNALDTITTFTTNDHFASTIAIDQANAVGQITAYAGGYSSVDDTLRVLRATAPAVASNTGQGIGSPINGILLESNTTLAAQKTEIERIVAHGLADANPKDQPKPDLLDGYYFLVPTNFQWYGMLMSADENNRGIVYDASDRFLLIGMNIAFDTELSSWTVTPTLSHETVGGGSQTISQVQPKAIPPGLPNIPSLAAYPGFPPLPGLWQPPGSIIIPPLGEADGDPLSQLDILTLQGEVGVWADITEVFVTQDVATNKTPTWISKFTISGSMEVKDVKFDPHGTGMYILVNDGAQNSKLWYTDNVFASIPSWSDTTFSDIDYTTIRTSSTPGRVYIFGIDTQTTTATVDLLNGNGRVGLTPSNRTSPQAGSSHAPGSYDIGNDLYKDDGSLAIGGGKVCDIEYNIPGGMLLQTAAMVAEGTRNNVATSGEKICEISLDGNAVGATATFPAGFYSAGSIPGTINMSKNFGGVDGSTILFHCSMDKFLGIALARITSVTITMTATGNGQAAYRLSDDHGASFGNLYKTASQISPLSEPGFDSGAADDFSYMAGSAIILEAENEEGIETKAGGASAGTQAKAIWAYGTNALADMVFATDIAFGGLTMAEIVDDVQGDITPNDGVDGFVNSRNSICMSRVSDTHVWFMGTFGANTKLAYTDDRGATPWTISGESFTASATYIRVKDTDVLQVYIIDTGILKYSKDGGASFEIDRIVPNNFGILFEVR